MCGGLCLQGSLCLRQRCFELTQLARETHFLILVGRFLQARRNIVPWYSLSRLLVISCYTLTGLLTFLLTAEYAVIATLIIWALATLPQTALAVAFSVVMNAVAGNHRRLSHAL